MFRGAEKTVSFLLSIGENREPTTDAKRWCESIFWKRRPQKQIFQNSRGVCFPPWIGSKNPVEKNLQGPAFCRAELEGHLPR